MFSRSRYTNNPACDTRSSSSYHQGSPAYAATVTNVQPASVSVVIPLAPAPVPVAKPAPVSAAVPAISAPKVDAPKPILHNFTSTSTSTSSSIIPPPVTNAVMEPAMPLKATCVAPREIKTLVTALSAGMATASALNSSKDSNALIDAADIVRGGIKGLTIVEAQEQKCRAGREEAEKSTNVTVNFPKPGP